MRKLDNLRSGNFHFTNLIDLLAIITAALWLSLMLVIGCNAGIQFWIALKRGVLGAILVYTLVFLGLQAAVRLALKSAEETQSAGSGQETIQATEPSPAEAVSPENLKAEQ
jgi:hypothetical protein